MKSDKRRAIRDALGRLGMQAKPDQVCEVLDNYGIYVSERLVHQVRMQILRDEAKATRERTKRPPGSKTRRRPQQRKIPPRRY